MLITADNWRRSFFDGMKVLLDGIEQKDVVQADGVVGFIERLVRDERGNRIPQRYGYQVERITGAVQFVGQRRFNDDDRKARAERKRERRRARNLLIANGRTA